jgi:hypothetical protein
MLPSRIVGTMACALSSAALLEGEASAFERQWHVGLDGGYALGAFPGANVSGFDVGVHGTYGLTDAFNLRLHADLSAFDLPAPRTSALLVNTGLGAEYVIDILRWVPYVGVTAGPNVMLVQDGSTVPHLGVEVLGGLGYQLSRSWSVGGEARYRLLLLGEPTVSPTHGFIGVARVAYAWGS